MNKTPKIPFSYQGSKLSELGMLRGIIPSNSAIIEPFLGTGIVSYEFGKNNSCLGNDFNKDIQNIWNNANNREFLDLCMELMKEENRYEEFYYSTREYFNKSYFNSDEYSPQRAAYYYYLVNSSHCGMIRYGPNGFNSSFKLFLLNGRRYNTEKKLKLLQEFANKFIKISSDNAIDFIKRYENSLDQFDLIYCDPPYTNSASTYIGSWSNDNLKELDEYLFYISKNTNIKCIMSNYFNNEINYRGSILLRFNKKRLASTTVTMSDNIIIGYGFGNIGIEKFF